jgi:hypothetical protein
MVDLNWYVGPVLLGKDQAVTPKKPVTLRGTGYQHDPRDFTIYRWHSKLQELVRRTEHPTLIQRFTPTHVDPDRAEVGPTPPPMRGWRINSKLTFRDDFGSESDPIHVTGLEGFPSRGLRRSLTRRSRSGSRANCTLLGIRMSASVCCCRGGTELRVT